MCFRTAEALLTPLRIFLTGGPGYLRLAQGLRRLTQGLRKAYARLTQGLRKAYAALTCIRGLYISLNYIVAHM